MAYINSINNRKLLGYKAIKDSQTGDQMVKLFKLKNGQTVGLVFVKGILITVLIFTQPTYKSTTSFDNFGGSLSEVSQFLIAKPKNIEFQNYLESLTSSSSEINLKRFLKVIDPLISVISNSKFLKIWTAKPAECRLAGMSQLSSEEVLNPGQSVKKSLLGVHAFSVSGPSRRRDPNSEVNSIVFAVNQNYETGPRKVLKTYQNNKRLAKEAEKAMKIQEIDPNVKSAYKKIEAGLSPRKIGRNTRYLGKGIGSIRSGKARIYYEEFTDRVEILGIAAKELNIAPVLTLTK